MIDEEKSLADVKQKLNILIVDDSIEDYELISLMICSDSDMAYELHWAKDSQEAKAAIKNLLLDLVAVDYNLGNESGIDVIKSLSHEYPHLPYIMITGVEDPDLYKLGLAAGATDFIAKNDNNTKLFDKTVQFAVKNKRIQNNLKAVNESKKRLMSLLVDDLETPLSDLVKTLSTLKSSSERLTKYEITDFLTDAYRSSHAALAGIYSIIEKGNGNNQSAVPNFTMVNLTDLVSGVLKLMAIDAEKKSVELRYHGKTDLKVYCDEKLLNVVIRRLIAYAIRSAKNGEIIEVLTNVVKGLMGISVRNRDYVIPHDQISNLRLGKSDKEFLDKRDHDSLVKLDTCRHLLDLMGTSLQIESTPELGTKFTFELPIDLPGTIEEARISPKNFDIPY